MKKKSCMEPCGGVKFTFPKSAPLLYCTGLQLFTITLGFKQIYECIYSETIFVVSDSYRYFDQIYFPFSSLVSLRPPSTSSSQL